jgi:chaperonin GroES
MNLKMIRNRILFRRLSEDTETEGGLLIPDVARRPSVEAEVVSVGPQAAELKVGDIVMVDLWKGTQFTYDGKSYWMVDEDRVSATA